MRTELSLQEENNIGFPSASDLPKSETMPCIIKYESSELTNFFMTIIILFSIKNTIKGLGILQFARCVYIPHLKFPLPCIPKS